MNETFNKSKSEPAKLKLRAGEWVEVRSKEEILATLDANSQYQKLPFMPEMLAYSGLRFQVWTRAHKTCDTVDKTGGRRMENAVHLNEIRCDGKAHGNCDAACLIFWKEAWLKRVESPQSGETETSSEFQPKAKISNPVQAGCSEA